MSLAAFTVPIQPHLSANRRVPFLRVYRRRGNPPLGEIGVSKGNDFSEFVPSGKAHPGRDLR